MRVLYAIDSLRMGGAESLLTALVRELPNHGVESVVWAAAPAFADPALVEALRRTAAEVDLVEADSVFDTRIARSIRRLARRHRVDVVHSHLHVASVHSRVAAATLRLPHVTTIHTPPGPAMEDSRRRAYADGLTARLSRRIVAPSDAVADAYARAFRVPRSRFVVVPNAPAAAQPADGFDRDTARDELGVGRGAPLVACVARLQAAKGIDDLIDAVATLRERVPELHVVVAGAGPEHERLAAHSRAAGADASVRLLGARADVGRILAAADVFCLPSRHEGLPVSLLEGMAAGLPCVATRVGGVPELVRHGENGLLVEAAAPAALAAALERVVSDRALAQRLGAAAQTTVEERFSLAAAARRHAELYTELTR